MIPGCRSPGGALDQIPEEIVIPQRLEHLGHVHLTSTEATVAILDDLDPVQPEAHALGRDQSLGQNPDEYALKTLAGVMIVADAIKQEATRHGGGPRLVTAVCAEPSILLEISEAALDRVAMHSSEIWRAIAAFTYEDLRNALRMVAEVIALRPRERIAARLLAIAGDGEFADNPVLRVSQELLGEMMGVTRKTVNFHLSAFERNGLIRLGYRRIELCDLYALRAIANG